MLTIAPSSDLTTSAIKPWFPQTQNQGPIHTVEVLHDPAWIHAVFSLHEQVRTETAHGKTPVLICKSEAYFLDLLSGKTGLLLGGFAGGELAGLTALKLCDTFAKACAEGIITCTDAAQTLAPSYPNGPVVIIQSVCVLHQHKKNGLSQYLLPKAIQQAKEMGCTDAFAQVAAHNQASLKMFEKVGFDPIATWTNDYERVLVHKAV
ncbi:MAG: GNAT family N-acetyltransferase [Alphaproteobacteria bacterium]|nr:GNAT family N-acetyltransferase [Alphaproteobacteria bacterium]